MKDKADKRGETPIARAKRVTHQPLCQHCFDSEQSVAAIIGNTPPPVHPAGYPISRWTLVSRQDHGAGEQMDQYHGFHHEAVSMESQPTLDSRVMGVS
jgi:hypothetical protein